MLWRLNFFKRFDVLLILIVLLAGIVRFAYLDLFPPLLLQDEANIGFNAISIAKTGRDEWGVFYPLNFHSFGDNKQPVYIYATTLIYLVTGWQPALPRIPSAIAGTMTVFLVAILIKKKLKSKYTALVVALIVAVSPWAIHLSRMALEANLALTFFLGGMVAMSYSKGKYPLRWLSLAALCFALSAYTYIAYRFVVAVWLVVTTVQDYWTEHQRNLFEWKNLIYSKSVFLLVATGLLILPTVFLAGNFTRYNQTALITPDVITAHLHLYQDTCFLVGNAVHFPPLDHICRIVWNAKTLPVELLLQNTIQHLSPQFLFFTGDSTINRNPTQSGMLYWFLFPIYGVGFALAFKNWQKYSWLLWGWLITLIPSILTGSPHFIRLVVNLPFTLFLIALGIQWLGEKWRWTHLALIVCTSISFGFFILKYPIIVFENSHEFLAHSQEASKVAYAYWQQGKTVYFDLNLIPEPQSYIAYWNQLDPARYQELVSDVLHDNQGFMRPLKLGDQLLFQEGDYPKVFCDPHSSNIVFISHHNPTNLKPSKTIYNNTGVHAMAMVFDIDDIKQQKEALAAFCAKNKIPLTPL